jgi:hypothetical protein
MPKTSKPDARIEALYADFLKLLRAWDNAPDLSDEQVDQMGDQLFEIERRLFTAPAQTMRGLARKFDIWRTLFPDEWETRLEHAQDLAALMRRAVLSDVYRLAGMPAA